MTRLELNKALREYSQEDMDIAKGEGQVAIAQTLKGLITLKYAEVPFIAYEVTDGFSTSLTGLMNEEQTIEFLMSVYDVSEVEVVD